jgi:hypothetical protein
MYVLPDGYGSDIFALNLTALPPAPMNFTLKETCPNQWARKKGTHLPSDYATATVGTRIYTFGGEYQQSGHPTTSAIFLYDTVKGVSEDGPRMAVARHGLRAAAVGDVIYLSGGWQQYDKGLSDLHESFGPC